MTPHVPITVSFKPTLDLAEALHCLIQLSPACIVFAENISTVRDHFSLPRKVLAKA